MCFCVQCMNMFCVVYVCVPVHVYAHMWRTEKDGADLPLSLSTLFLGLGSVPELGTSIFPVDRLAYKSSDPPVPTYPSTEGIQSTWLFRWVWESELRFTYLHSQHSYPLNHLLNSLTY